MVDRIINGKRLTTEGFEDLYPFEPHFLDINGHTLHYLDQGDGPPLLMVHGNPTWSFYFRHLIPPLSENFRTIVPDHMGCGFSDKPPAGSGPETDPGTYDYTLASRVRDLDSLVSSLDFPAGSGEKISLIVHDWGGMIGLAWALDNLDRIDKLVITNTSGFFLPPGKTFPLALWMIKYLRFLAVPAVLGFNAFSGGAAVLGSETPLDHPVKKGLTAPYNSWRNRIATLKFVQDIPITKKDRSWTIVDHVDRNLTKLDPDRLLFLWGAKDFVFDTKFLDEFQRRFPNARSHVFKDAGHYLFEDKPKQTLDLIKDFLSG
ncbi:alpha/beta fold hydrolase [Desulfospira joergensenii]|uniref:alpha/beta fold hydrolase n=1 Tax=Desulfospira joergensenii TaxID=53329 RepID=UPI0003B77232|nr:alpha/beta fold hydrolase [Desulfospira joergensenii]